MFSDNIHTTNKHLKPIGQGGNIMLLADIIEEEYINNLDETVIGIDIGSRSGKAVLIYKDKLYCSLTATGINMQSTAEKLIADLLKQANIELSEVKYIVGTGYGRISLTFKDIPSSMVTEISCHAMGAHYQNKNTRTIIDIGGQDSKAIKVKRENGKVEEFIMNDKCAAGSGRFLEKVATLIDTKIEDFGNLALNADKELVISSQCVVFAESEVVSLKAQGESKENIASAINYAIARRVRNLVNRMGIEPDLIFSGGVSNNSGMKAALEKVVGFPIIETRLNMIYNGALGAAVYAIDFYKSNQ
jgi:predicted CoA-substrate-specific enzyme activase